MCDAHKTYRDNDESTDGLERESESVFVQMQQHLLPEGDWQHIIKIKSFKHEMWKLNNISSRARANNIQCCLYGWICYSKMYSLISVKPKSNKSLKDQCVRFGASDGGVAECSPLVSPSTFAEKHKKYELQCKLLVCLVRPCSQSSCQSDIM